MKRLRLKERSGFSAWWLRLLYILLYPFCHCRNKLPKWLQDKEDGVVFIANHYTVFGPLAFFTSVPLQLCAWVNDVIVNPETTETAIYDGIQQIFPFLNENGVRKLCHKLAALVYRTMEQLHVIPVSRTDTSRLLGTMRKSIQALDSGANLLIFPETGEPEYSLTSVTPFFSAFATIGGLYQRRTGKSLTFCPVYIDQHHRKLYYGEPISFSGELVDMNAETQRISEHCYHQIRSMAEESRPKEKKAEHILSWILAAVRFVLLVPIVSALSAGNLLLTGLYYLLGQVLREIVQARTQSGLAAVAGHLAGNAVDATLLAMTIKVCKWNRLLLLLIAACCCSAIVNSVHCVRKCKYCTGIGELNSYHERSLMVICLVQVSGVVLLPILSFLVIVNGALSIICSTASFYIFNNRIIHDPVCS